MEDDLKIIDDFININILYGNKLGMVICEHDKLSKAISNVLDELNRKENFITLLQNKIDNSKDWIENTISNSNMVGCNIGDLQQLLDILEG